MHAMMVKKLGMKGCGAWLPRKLNKKPQEHY
jgi:hypothetical protein